MRQFIQILLIFYLSISFIIYNIFYLFQLMSKNKTSFLNNWAEVGGHNSGIVRELSTGR